MRGIAEIMRENAVNVEPLELPGIANSLNAGADEINRLTALNAELVGALETSRMYLNGLIVGDADIVVRNIDTALERAKQ